MEEKIMMKHLLKLGTVLTIAGGILCACNSDPVPAQPEGVFILSAVLPDAQTKTALGAVGAAGEEVEILWKKGDKISVNGILSDAVPAAKDGEQNVEFTVSGSPSAPYQVLYPGTTSANVISLPATQNYVENSFDGAAAVAYGNATQTSGGGYSVSLNNFCGLISFALKGSATLDKIVLNALGGENLFGDFTLAADGNGFTGAFSGGTSGSLTYDCNVTLGSSDTYFYIALPAQTYSAGIEALVYQADGAFMRLKFWGEGKALSGKDLVAFPSKTYDASRVGETFSLDGLTAEDGGEPTSEAPGITVATYNVMRLDTDNRPAAATTGDSNGKIARPANAIVPDCAEMREALGRAIYNTAADLIGFNEIGDDMYSSGLAHSLQDIATDEGAAYTWQLNYPGSSSGNYHYCNGFAYKSSVLQLEDSGKAWLRYNSTSYSTSSQSDSGDPNRYVVWAKFKHKASGKEFYFFVTQLPTYGQDGGSGTSNTNMSGGVNAFANSKTLSTNRRILVGDMNSAPGHSNQAGYNKLKEYWTDAYEAVSAAGNLASYYNTYSGTQSGTGDNYLYSISQFTKNHPERRIDHIMTNGACTAQSYRTVRNVYEFGSGEDAVTCCPSDHLPVVAYITLD